MISFMLVGILVCRGRKFFGSLVGRANGWGQGGWSQGWRLYPKLGCSWQRRLVLSLTGFCVPVEDSKMQLEQWPQENNGNYFMIGDIGKWLGLVPCIGLLSVLKVVWMLLEVGLHTRIFLQMASLGSAGAVLLWSAPPAFASPCRICLSCCHCM